MCDSDSDSDSHHRGGCVVQHATEVAHLLPDGEVRPPELSVTEQSGAPHAPSVLLHEQSPRFGGARPHGHNLRDVLDLPTQHTQIDAHDYTLHTRT